MWRTNRSCVQADFTDSSYVVRAVEDLVAMFGRTPCAYAYDRGGYTWTAGPLAGPVLEVDWALRRRLFLHLDAALPAGYLRIDDGMTRRWDGVAYVQSTLGLGLCL